MWSSLLSNPEILDCNVKYNACEGEKLQHFVMSVKYRGISFTALHCEWVIACDISLRNKNLIIHYCAPYLNILDQLNVLQLKYR